jgi:hypothetical protein
VTSLPTAAVLKVLDAGVPTVVGNVLAGSTMSVNLGVWPDVPSKFTYRWLRNGVAITDAIYPTYKTVSADVGAELSVRVTASKTGFASSVVTSAGVTIEGRVFTSDPQPTIVVPAAGVKVGQTLKAVAGVWSPLPTLTYRWMREGIPIPGATSTTYVLASADAGAQISVQVTAKKSLYATAVRESNPTAAVTGGIFTAPVPKITGSAALGQTLNVTTGTWSPTATFTYQWKRDGVAIGGETGTSYPLAIDDIGAKITVTVTGERVGTATKSVTSLPTVAVVDVLDAGEPTVVGDVTAGSTMSVDLGVWPDAPSKFTYRWLRNGVAITDAIYPTYKTVSADVGAELSVRVTASKTGFASSVVTSAGVTIEGRVFTSDPEPTIVVPAAGAKVGQTLTAAPGVWAPLPTLTYKWLRGGVPIPGATSSTYVLVSADAGSQITVEVTAKKSLYATTVRVSDPTAEVTGGVFTTVPNPTITVPAAGAKVGQTLKAVAGVWTPTPTLAYRWLRDGVPITGATLSTYLLVAADAGHAISVRVTATKATYVTTVELSAPVGLIVGTAFPVAIAAVGDFVVGDTVEPGIYVTLGTPSACYWERLSALDGDPASVIESDSGPGPWTVEILETDYAFSSFGCNGWIKLSDVAS